MPITSVIRRGTRARASRGHGRARAPRRRSGRGAGEHLQRRRLAGAVRAEEADDLALADLEDDVVDRAHLAVLRRNEALAAARSPASRSGTRNVLFSSATLTAGSGTRENLDDAPVRILLVSQMYPSAAPDFGVFVQGLERELTAQGHVFERVVLDRRGGGKLRHAGWRAGPCGRRGAFGPTSSTRTSSSRPALGAACGAGRAGAARRHRARAGRRQPDRVPVRPPAGPAGRQGRGRGDRGLRLAARAARRVDPAAAAKTEVVDCGVDLERFRRSSARRGRARVPLRRLADRAEERRPARDAFGRLGEGR